MAIKQQSALDKDIEIPFLTKKKVKPRDNERVLQAVRKYTECRCKRCQCS